MIRFECEIIQQRGQDTVSFVYKNLAFCFVLQSRIKQWRLIKTTDTFAWRLSSNINAHYVRFTSLRKCNAYVFSKSHAHTFAIFFVTFYSNSSSILIHFSEMNHFPRKLFYLI